MIIKILNKYKRKTFPFITKAILLFSFLFLFAEKTYSQAKTLSGIVSDSLNTPLENANVLAKSRAEKPEIKFAIAD
ncbi:hypothetical protein CHX27_00180, partial [Flavobacterium aurantiibacter]